MTTPPPTPPPAWGSSLTAVGLWERGQQAPAPPPPGSRLEPQVLSRDPPSERAVSLPKPWAPTGGQQAGGGTRHTVSLAERAASSPQGPVCPDFPGPEAPSDQALLGTGSCLWAQPPPRSLSTPLLCFAEGLLSPVRTHLSSLCLPDKQRPVPHSAAWSTQIQ